MSLYSQPELSLDVPENASMISKSGLTAKGTTGHHYPGKSMIAIASPSVLVDEAKVRLEREMEAAIWPQAKEKIRNHLLNVVESGEEEDTSKTDRSQSNHTLTATILILSTELPALTEAMSTEQFEAWQKKETDQKKIKQEEEDKRKREEEEKDHKVCQKMGSTDTYLTLTAVRDQSNGASKVGTRFGSSKG